MRELMDDRLDALAGAVTYYVARMARDTHMAALDRKPREFDKQLEKFIKHAMGRHGIPPTRFASAIIRCENKRPSRVRNLKGLPSPWAALIN